MKNSNTKLYITAFSLPIFLYLVICIISNITPFGSNSFLISDLNMQYIDYLAYYKEALSGNNDLFYTFSKSLGGDMVGLSAYYTLSPFNLILLFFSKSQFPLAITIIILLKSGMCGLTCAIFLNNSVSFSKHICLFSSAYALMGYNIAYCFNIMWADSVIILPIVALGIENLVKQKKSTLFIISLTYAIITCYYIGFMLCVFSVIYFLYFYAVSNNADIKSFFANASNFAFACLMCGGLSAFILIPVLKSLSGTKAGFDISIFNFDSNFHFKDFLLKFFTGSANLEQVYDGLPNIFCGTVVILFAVIFFFCKNISFKEKAISASVLGFLYLNMKTTALNLIWHGFNFPACFPYRYSFVFSFFLIYFAYKAYSNKGNISTVSILTSSVLILGFGFFALFFSDKHNIITAKNAFVTLFSVAAAAVFLIIILHLTKKSVVAFALIALIALQFLSLIINGLTIQTLIPANPNEHADFINQTGQAVDYVKQLDSGLYRMEKDYFRSFNDAMQFGYNGLTHFSSTEKTKTKSFISNFGFTYSNAWVRYGRGSTYTADCVLGVKYLLSKNHLHKPFELINNINGINIYKNPLALPLAFTVESSFHSVMPTSENIFEFQNNFMCGISSSDEKIFIPAEISKITTDFFDVISYPYGNKYIKQDEINVPSINYTVTATSNQPLYAHFSSPHVQSSELLVNGISLGYYFDTYQWDAVYLGTFKKGEQITVTITSTLKELFIEKPSFYHENLAVLSNFCQNILSNTSQENLSKISSSHLVWQGNATSSGTVVFTIPYENGWKAYLDGQQTNIIPIFDNIIGIKIPKGTHTLKIVFTPDGLYTGIIVSAFTVILFLYLLIRKKHYKTNTEKSTVTI